MLYHGTIIQSEVLDKVKSEAVEEQKERVVVLIKSGERLVANLNKSHWEKFISEIYKLEQKEESEDKTNVSVKKETADELLIGVEAIKEL